MIDLGIFTVPMLGAFTIFLVAFFTGDTISFDTPLILAVTGAGGLAVTDEAII